MVSKAPHTTHYYFQRKTIMCSASHFVLSVLSLTAKQTRLPSAQFLPLRMRQYFLIPTKALKSWIIGTTCPSLKTPFLPTALLLSQTAYMNASGCCLASCPSSTLYLCFCLYVLLIRSPNMCWNGVADFLCTVELVSK